MEQKYELSELEGYFQCMVSPDKAVSQINSVIVQLTQWFLEVDKQGVEEFYLKDCVDFLLGLRCAIEEVKAI